ncbi:MAG: hypothetical protein RLZZ628_1425 [Bacteroidota bacterium]|jgi:hypothetical protein
MAKQLELYPQFSVEDQMAAEKQIADLQKVVDYQITEFTIEFLVQKYQQGKKTDTNDIFVPNYQRKFVWDRKKQSLFIESLLLGLPIPYMFSADSPEHEGRVEIVDGSQRLRTLEAFLDNKLVLTGLKKLNLLNEFRFEDLPLSRQRRFKGRSIKIIKLTDKADYEVRKDIFERINITATVLSDMEIRRGAYESDFTKFLEHCANNNKFIQLCPISNKRNDREEAQEMVLRFFAYGENLHNFTQIVKDFNDDYTKEKSKGFDAAVMEEDFENMLDFVDKHFPYGFKKGVNYSSTPRVRFETLSIGVHLALKENPNLMPAQPITNWIDSKEFKEHVTSDAANNRNRVIARINYVKNKLLFNL